MPRPASEGSGDGHSPSNGSQWIVSLNALATPESMDDALDAACIKRFTQGRRPAGFGALQDLEEQADIEALLIAKPASTKKTAAMAVLFFPASVV